MKRGPPPARGFDIAIPIGLIRGRVMLFQPLPDHVCDFTITGNGIFALVRLMSATRLHASITEITREYSDAIAGLLTIPFGGPVSRELWLYSRYGTMRFFRVAEAGLVEIDCYGFLFVNGKPVITLPAIPCVSPCPSGQAVTGPGDSAPAGLAVTGPPGSGPMNPKSPIIRWLKKKNASKKPGPEENDPIGPINPVLKKDCAHKKPAAARNQVPAIEVVTQIREPVADDLTGLACEGSPVGDRDRVPASGKSVGEK
jgi:hypothetical protein